MKKSFIILFLTLFLTCPTFAQNTAKDIEKATTLYNQAIDLYGQDEIDKSIELFAKAVQLNPGFYEAHYNLAQILMSVDKNEEAIKSLEAILKIKPEDSETLYNLGRIQYKRGYLSKAHKYLTEIKASDAQYQSAKILISKIEKRQEELNIESKLKEHKNVADTQGNNIGASLANFAAPSGVVVDSLGNIYVASFSDNCIYKITPQGKKSTITKAGFLKGPIGLALDKNENIYVANYSLNTIAKITKQGEITVFATIERPYCITFDELNNRLYVTEQNTNKLYKFDL